jgi:alpha-tubulin suppressor-like RCC1 family protein
MSGMGRPSGRPSFFAQLRPWRADDRRLMKLPLTLGLVLLATASCKVKDPLYCDENTPCTDPARPFCDLNGEYPASEGIKRTCIADPFPDGGPDGEDDAGAERRIVQIETGETHSCALFNDGGVRCWGTGILGYGREEVIGDNESPSSAGDVPLGAPAQQIGLGSGFSCVLYRAGNVRCWGDGFGGKLGYGNEQNLGAEGDTPSMLEDVDLGGTVEQIAVGYEHSCALLESGSVRCWGYGSLGKLGYGNEIDIGDDETPGSHEPVELGGSVISIAAGASHTCALLDGGRVQCWGSGFHGILGYGDVSNPNVGDDETPADAGDVNVGAAVAEIAPGGSQTCARLTSGAVRCWGRLDRTGYPAQTEDVGDDEAPATLGDLTIGGTVVELRGHATFTCARLDTGSVRCWGADEQGSLGYGDGDQVVGDDETPAEAGNVAVGGTVVGISAGNTSIHSCVILESGDVRCWGLNLEAELGLLHTDNIGDNETPDSQDPVEILD